METVSVHDLVLDRALNPRRMGVDQEVVEHYAAIYADVIWPAILVHRDTRKLVDGWHRVEAAKRAGVYQLPVIWVDAKEEDLFALAVKANLAHGLRLTKEERLRAIIQLTRDSWTNERIAEVLGCGMGLVNRAEKAEDLRIKFKVHDHPGASLPCETLVEVASLPPEYHDEIAELAVDVEADAKDVRRAARAIKKGVVDTADEIRRAMTDPEFAKMRLSQAGKSGESWLMTFATLVDQMEGSQMAIQPAEREAAVALFRRLRMWSEEQLVALGDSSLF